MIEAAKSSHLSNSKWIAQLIQDKVTNEWPKSIVKLAGSWPDFPTADEIRSGTGEDAQRESI